MENFVGLNKLQELFQDAIHEAVKEKSLEELQTLDWFTLETDFFLEQKYKKAS